MTDKPSEPRRPVTNWRLGFMRRGTCWRLFELPHCQEYYSGRMRWWTWWRFFLVIERF